MFHHVSSVLDPDGLQCGLITLEQNDDHVTIRRLNLQQQIQSTRKIFLLGPVVQASVSKNGYYVLLLSQSPADHYWATIIYDAYNYRTAQPGQPRKLYDLALQSFLPDLPNTIPDSCIQIGSVDNSHR